MWTMDRLQWTVMVADMVANAMLLRCSVPDIVTLS